MCLHGRVRIQSGFDGLFGARPVQSVGRVQLAGGMASTKAWCGDAGADWLAGQQL